MKQPEKHHIRLLSEFERNTILITGGAGFIGSHLCVNLLKQGFHVLCVDNFNDFYDPQIKKNNIDDIRSLSGTEASKFQLLVDDIRDLTSTRQALEQTPCDLVIHAAAMPGVRTSIKYPAIYYDVNVRGTMNLLELCRQANIKNIIFASSSSVYGEGAAIPFSENSITHHPISPYAATKRACEMMLYTHHHLYQANVACLRFFNVYGPRCRPDTAVYKFTKYILESLPLPVLGNGSSSRDYTHINDIVKGVIGAIKLLKKAQRIGKPKYEIFNLGDCHSVRLMKIIELLELYLDKKAIIEFLPAHPSDLLLTCADIRKAREHLEYQPEISIEEGLEDFVQWYLRKAHHNHLEEDNKEPYQLNKAHSM